MNSKEISPQRKKILRELAFEIKGLYSDNKGIESVNKLVLKLCAIIIELTE